MPTRSAMWSTSPSRTGATTSAAARSGSPSNRSRDGVTSAAVSRRAVATVERTTPSPAPPSHRYRETLFRRLRSAVSTVFFEGLAATGRLHPAANPARHGVEVESDVVYG